MPSDGVHHSQVREFPGTVRGVIFDGDDTLWLTEPLYDEARTLARDVVTSAGLDGAAWEAAQRTRDTENVARFGHSAERFPTSCIEALSMVGGEELPDYDDVRAQVWDAASSVFVSSAPLRAGAVELLEQLARRGLRLGLLTKGDQQVQQRRIEGSGLSHFFDLVRIVERKTPAAFASMARDLGLHPGEVISIGNSVESDIRPSHRADIYAVWLPAYVWEYERHDPAVEAQLHQVDALGDVMTLVSG